MESASGDDRCLLDVLAILGPDDLVAASQVCRRWRCAVFGNPQLFDSLRVPGAWSRRPSVLSRFVPMARDITADSETALAIASLQTGIPRAVRFTVTDSSKVDVDARDRDGVLVKLAALFSRARAPRLRELCIACVDFPVMFLGAPRTDDFITALSLLDGEVALCLCASTEDGTGTIDGGAAGNVLNEVSRAALCSADSPWACHRAIEVMKSRKSLFKQTQVLSLEFYTARWVDGRTEDSTLTLSFLSTQCRRRITDVLSQLDSGTCVNSMCTNDRLQACALWFVCYPCAMKGNLGLCRCCAANCHRSGHGAVGADGHRHRPLYQYLAYSPFCDCQCLHDKVNWRLLDNWM